MKSLIQELIFLISSFIAASMLCFEIYPQYHEWCIRWIYLGYIVAIADVIRKMVVHRREKNHRKDIQK